MDVDDVLDKLKGVRPRGASGSSWTARCPCHEDRRNSLGIDIGRGGSVLVCCWAGCSQVALRAALGLGNGARTSGASTRHVQSRQRRVFSASYYAVLSLPGLTLTHGWDYRYADGSPAFSVYRLQRPDGGKEIRPVKPVDGGYDFGLPPAPRPLYRLPEVLAHDGVVVVCEGEKATDAAVAAGWCATTSVGGASAARKSDWSQLAMRRVVVWPDNDEPGLAYAETVRTTLVELGATVSVMDPVGSDGDDAADCEDPSVAILEATA